MSDRVESHRSAQRTHEQALERHGQAAAFWAERGDDERAELERRNMEIERAAAELEGDRAALEERRAAEDPGHWPGSAA